MEVECVLEGHVLVRSRLDTMEDRTKVQREQSSYVANSPSNSTFLARSGSLIRLAVNAEVHDVISADGAVVDDDIPSPESDRVPL